VDGPAVGRLGIFDRARDAVAEFALAAGQRGEAALTRAPIAGRRVEQRLGQLVRLQPIGNVGRLEIIGEEELDAAKPGLRRRAEAVEELHFLEHHAEIGGEIRHFVLL
jgi:hypothetical protein